MFAGGLASFNDEWFDVCLQVVLLDLLTDGLTFVCRLSGLI